MPTARLGAAAAAIGTKIYVVGGYNAAGLLNVNEIYDTVANTWSTGAPMPTARWSLAAASANGILYAIGGEVGTPCCSETNVVEAYDPVHDSWSTKTAMPTSRNSLTAVDDAKLIYAVGGFLSGSRLSNVERYDPVHNTWLPRAPLLLAKSGASIGVIGKTIVAASGLATSGLTTIIAPPPSLEIQQSSLWSGSATIGELTTSSTVTSLRSMACGLCWAC